jgi:hypothetical protein
LADITKNDKEDDLVFVVMYRLTDQAILRDIARYARNKDLGELAELRLLRLQKLRK